MGSIHPERRAARRDRVSRGATLLLPDGEQDCVLLDVSEIGARLETVEDFTLPQRVVLRFTDGRQAICEPRWTVGRRSGVRFVQADGSATARRRRAARILDRLDGMEAPGLFDMLHRAAFLDSARVGEAAAMAEAAIQHLRDVLLAETKPRDPH
jgi:hypothetical protein